MCTVTFLPFNKSDFVLTSNRDEQSSRLPAIQPLIYFVHNTPVAFPKDQQGEGTWIATSGISFTLCLLNGAFETHTKKSNYKISRGLVLLDFFAFNNVCLFLEKYDFTNIEPFTLLLLDTKDRLILTEARWDGFKIHQKIVDVSLPHIWSSVTLYSPETISDREKWYQAFLNEQQTYSDQNILDFHQFGGMHDKNNSVMMDRLGKVKTQSITSIKRKMNVTQMTYKDVINEKIYHRRIS